MEGPSSGGGSGGPAPFLLKTYEMVDDSSTDHIVSWTLTGTSFVVWNPPDFSKILLPTYFKHNNFSSFIRQLNTYGFHKIDPERWEFANEDFVKDKTDLLKNIHRRKPIHSHSHPPVDPERSTLTEEIDRLSRENAELQARLRYQQQQSTTWSLVENLKHRIKSLDERQRAFLNYFEKSVQDPDFVQQLAKKIESMDISAYAKRRRLPQAQDHSHFQLHIDNFTEDRTASRPETMSIIFQQDFSDKLRLELSPAVSDQMLVSNSTHSSNEEMGGSPWKLSEDEQIYQQGMNHSLSISPEAIDLTDTGTSLTFQKESSFPLRPVTNVSLGLQPGQKTLLSSEDGDNGLISCQLNLTLASSTPLQPNRADLLAEDARDFSLRSEITIAISSEARAVTMDSNEAGGASLSSSQDSQNNEGGLNNTAQPIQVNDLFWEQFLTERPGTSDDEEAISNDRASPCDERHDDRGVCGGMSKAAKSLRKLSLLSG